jgi:hypothetical protein
MYKKDCRTMSTLIWLRNLFSHGRTKDRGTVILPLQEQVKTWRNASRDMGWKIRPEEFDLPKVLPKITEEDRRNGYIGTALFYGFGDDGSGHAEPVLSGRLAWEYACKRRKSKTWQCEYVNFDRPDDIRLRPGAAARPKGFYFAKVQSGEQYINLTVSQLRKRLGNNTGWGPEGFQLLAITHVHIADLMTERKIPFMALADYDVAPYGHMDFFDAPQLFCSNHVLGLGIGNVDRNYPLFGIPTLQICNER